MSTSTIQEKQQDLNSLCNKADQLEEPIYFTHNGKKYVLVSDEAFQYYEDLEDARLSKLAEEAKKEPGVDIPLEDYLKKHGL